MAKKSKLGRSTLLEKRIEQALQADPMRRFVYGLIGSIVNLQKTGMVKPKPRRVSAVDCAGCRAFILADSRAVMPSRCPICGRPAGEAVREFWLANQRRDPPAAGAYTPGYRKAKKA
jgi:hypothetical protein